MFTVSHWQGTSPDTNCHPANDHDEDNKENNKGDNKEDNKEDKKEDNKEDNKEEKEPVKMQTTTPLMIMRRKTRRKRGRKE